MSILCYQIVTHILCFSTQFMFVQLVRYQNVFASSFSSLRELSQFLYHAFPCATVAALSVEVSQVVSAKLNPKTPIFSSGKWLS